MLRVYRIHRHLPDGEAYVLSYDAEGLIAGVDGPLTVNDYVAVLAGDFDTNEEDLDWARDEDTAGHWSAPLTPEHVLAQLIDNHRLPYHPA